jgi:hypothetical protein
MHELQDLEEGVNFPVLGHRDLLIDLTRLSRLSNEEQSSHMILMLAVAMRLLFSNTFGRGSSASAKKR